MVKLKELRQPRIMVKPMEWPEASQIILVPGRKDPTNPFEVGEVVGLGPGVGSTYKVGDLILFHRWAGDLVDGCYLMSEQYPIGTVEITDDPAPV